MLAKRLRSNGIEINVSDSALDMLGESGFDPVYGARPLRRAIQQHLENRLAREILKGEFSPGDKVAIDFADGELQFTEEVVAEPDIGTTDTDARKSA